MSETGVRATVEWWDNRIHRAERELAQLRAMRAQAAGMVVADFPTAAKDAQWWEKKRQADLDDERRKRWERAAEHKTYGQLKAIE